MGLREDFVDGRQGFAPLTLHFHYAVAGTEAVEEIGHRHLALASRLDLKHFNGLAVSARNPKPAVVGDWGAGSLVRGAGA